MRGLDFGAECANWPRFGPIGPVDVVDDEGRVLGLLRFFIVLLFPVNGQKRWASDRNKPPRRISKPVEHASPQNNFSLGASRQSLGLQLRKIKHVLKQNAQVSYLQDQSSSDTNGTNTSTVLQSSSTASGGGGGVGRRGGGVRTRRRGRRRVTAVGSVLSSLGGSRQVGRVRLQERRNLGGVHGLDQRSGVGLVRARNNLVGGDGGSLTVGVGQELGSLTLLDGEGVGARGGLGGGLAGVLFSGSLGVRHTIVGDSTGQGDRGGSRSKAGRSSEDDGRELHCWLVDERKVGILGKLGGTGAFLYFAGRQLKEYVRNGGNGGNGKTENPTRRLQQEVSEPGRCLLPPHAIFLQITVVEWLPESSWRFPLCDFIDNTYGPWNMEEAAKRAPASARLQLASIRICSPAGAVVNLQARAAGGIETSSCQPGGWSCQATSDVAIYRYFENYQLNLNTALARHSLGVTVNHRAYKSITAAIATPPMAPFLKAAAPPVDEEESEEPEELESPEEVLDLEPPFLDTSSAALEAADKCDEWEDKKDDTSVV